MLTTMPLMSARDFKTHLVNRKTWFQASLTRRVEFHLASLLAAVRKVEQELCSVAPHAKKQVEATIMNVLIRHSILLRRC